MVLQTKVFVGSLPQGSNPEDLRKLFEDYGVVTECDIMNRCGFVHMQTEDQAAAAIRALHNSNFNGGVITVERGRIKERGPRTRPDGPTGGPRGVMKNGGSGGPKRGGHMGVRDAPYLRDRGMGHMRVDLRGQTMGGGGYERAIKRLKGSGHYAEDRYSSYGNYGEDSRGFSLMNGRNDSYTTSSHMYGNGHGYAAPYMDNNMFDDRHGSMYKQDMMDRRRLMMSSGYGRPPKSTPYMGNHEMYGKRSPMHGTPASGYNMDPYSQNYAPYAAMPHHGGPRGGGRGRGVRR